MAENEVDTIDFSLDLKGKATLELDFLKRVNDCSVLKDPSVLRVAVYRYEKLWLPFLHKMSKDEATDVEFTPPLDIHWVWHVHMLSPTHYRKDCKDIFGRMINHRLKYKEESNEMLKFTKQKWKRFHPDVDFDLPDEIEEILNLFPNIDNDDLNKSEFIYDVHAAAMRQQFFYYQVSLPHYKNDDFLKEAEDRYTKFIELNRAYPNKFLVPCYDIDLIWHTHQVHPYAYARDMKSILGWVLPHDDTDTDRNPDSKLTNSYDQTAKLWNEHFNESYPKPGVMYRGKPPSETLFNPSKDFLENLYLNKYKKFSLKTLEIFGIPTQIQKEAINVKLVITKVDYKNGEVVRKEVLNNMNIKIGPTQSHLDQKLNGWQPIVLKNNESSYLEVTLTETAFKFGRYNLQTLKMQNHLEFNVQSNRDIAYPILLLEKCNKINNTIKGLVNLEYVSHNTTREWETSSILHIQTGMFKKRANVDHDLLLCCGMATIERNQDFQIQTAIHKVLYEGGSEYLTVSIDHSLPLKMSVIRIRCEEKLMMLAHLVDSSTLGEMEYYKLSLKKGGHPYRAMILKDSKGDVGIGFANWVGMRKKILPRKGCKNGKSGHPGFFQFSYYDLRTNKEVFIATPNGRNFKMKFKSGVAIDFSIGIIVIPRAMSHTGLFTSALTFMISTLFLLVQPRPQIIPPMITTSVSKRPAYLGNTKNMLVNASGWEICNHIPTNVLVFSGEFSGECFLVSKEDTCTDYGKSFGESGQTAGCGPGCGGCGAACGGTSGGNDAVFGCNGYSDAGFGNNGSSNSGSACVSSSNGSGCFSSCSSSACGSGNSGSACGSGSSGSACGSSSSGSTCGSSSSGSTCGSSSSGSTCGSSNSGSTCGSSSSY